MEPLTEVTSEALRHRPPRWVRGVVLGLIAVGTVAGLTSTALIAVLAPRDPLLLLALESPLRNLVLARGAPLVPYVLIGTLRRIAPAVLYYLLGRWYGDDAIHWLEKHTGASGKRWIRRMQRVVQIADIPAVALFPIAPVGVAAGTLGMRPWVFVALSTLGSLGVVLACRFAGDALATPITAVLGVLQRHTLAATVALVALLALGTAFRALKTSRPRVSSPGITTRARSTPLE